MAVKARRRLVRVCLYPNCRVKYWEWNWTSEDYDIPLTDAEAVQAMTLQGANVEVACGDPRENHSHWEGPQFQMRYI